MSRHVMSLGHLWITFMSWHVSVTSRNMPTMPYDMTNFLLLRASKEMSCPSKTQHRRHESCRSHLSGIGMCCPTRGWLGGICSPILVSLYCLGIGSCCLAQPLLMEMNSPILVGLDVLGIGTCCLGGRRITHLVPIRDNCGCRTHRYSMVGIVGKLDYRHGKVSCPWLSAESEVSCFQ